MTWVKLEDRFDEDPRVVAAGPLGVALYVAGLAYCNRNLTDGFVPTSMARRLVDWGGDGMTAAHLEDGTILVAHAGKPVPVSWQYAIDLVVVAGLWTVTDGGYLVVDYLENQPSKAAVLARRTYWAQQKADFRAKKERQREAGRKSRLKRQPMSVVDSRADSAK